MAGFASSPWHRLWAAQSVIATLAAATTLWFVFQNFLPPVHQALKIVPDGTAIENGRLLWDFPVPASLGENPWFAVLADLNHSADLGQVADFQLEIGRTDVRLRSILGYSSASYSAIGLHSATSTIPASAWWGAREPMVLVGLFFAVGFGLFIIWQLLSLLYCVPVRMVAFIADRKSDWASARKLAGAALMPGALFLVATMLLYGIRFIPLIGFLTAFALHFCIGWLYVVVAPFFLDPMEPVARKANPFSADPPGTS